MSDYHCYIVDDEADSIEILQHYIQQTPQLLHIFSTTDPRKIFPVINKPGPPKITFLDIEMPGISGLELASLINNHTAIVFVTSHSHHALEAFEKDAYDYLVKPVEYSRFLKAVLKVQGRIQSNVQTAAPQKKSFIIKGTKQGEMINVIIDELVFIESLNNYVKVHTISGNHITYLTLKQCQFALDEDKFLQVHKSYVVNLERIVKLLNNQLTMDNNELVPIGSVYRPELLIRLKNRMFPTDRNSGLDD